MGYKKMCVFTNFMVWNLIKNGTKRWKPTLLTNVGCHHRVGWLDLQEGHEDLKRFEKGG
jgi:hypothetical protein